MKRQLEVKKVFVAYTLLLSAFFLPLTAAAESKSKTVRISCTVVPMIEMSQTDSFSMRSNLGKQLRMTESYTERAGQKVQLYSLTAL